ncbi:MAG: radical SAM protein [Planctomycetota bacterium]
MIRYEGSLFRPPSEAESLILQATIGCSYNECTFCGMYRDKAFRVRPLAELRAEIEWARRHLGAERVRKVFLADGDALVAKASFLWAICAALREAFPNLRRISCYASPQALQVRTVEEMRELRDAGVTLYYLGIESGDDEVLALLKKGVDSAEMIRVAGKAHAAGVALSTMILLGVGNRALSAAHARGSARIVNAIQPRFLSTLVVAPVPGTPLWEDVRAGRADLMTPPELAAELRAFLAGLELAGTIFRANHASNYLPLSGTLPKDKARMLGELDQVLADPDRARFVPEWMRGL